MVNIIGASEKMRNIVGWMNYQNESFNDKLSSISIIEKIYDYCDENDIEFADDFPMESLKEEKKHRDAIEKIAGVKLY